MVDAHDLGVAFFSPLKHGLLLGKYDEPQNFPEGDFRSSIPEFRENVTRPKIVTVRAQDVTGKSYEMRGEGLLARAFSHEIDHLRGILFIQHLSLLKRDLIKRRIRKLRKSGDW